MTTPNFDEPLAVLLERELSKSYGPMMSGESLRVALGYSSIEAFRQAIARHLTPIPVFGIERRRGKFALTKDVATWLAEQRDRAAMQMTQRKEGAAMT